MAHLQPSRTRSTTHARNVGVMNITPEEIKAHGIRGLGLDAIGVDLTEADFRRMTFAMDAAMITTPSAATLLQFTQAWLPGTIRILTSARKIDALLGERVVGSWEMGSVVQKVMESVGAAQVYSDHGNVPFSSYNATYEERDIVRFEQGFQVGALEDARAALMKDNAAGEKRDAAMMALEISRNRLGFQGFNNGSNRTYGLLNDPGLLAYATVPAGAGGSTKWMDKTFLEIIKDLRTAFAALRTRSGGNIDPKKAPITLATGVSVIEFLSIPNDLGTTTVGEWLKENYPNVRTEDAPEFDAANGGANVCYIYVEKVDATGDDAGQVIQQLIASKVHPLGIEKHVKTTVEDYTNALAGVMVTRPFAVYRITGV